VDHLWLFAVLVFGIIAVPGMDMAFVLSSTLVDGQKAGIAAIAGIVLGGMVHVAMSATGIGLLIQHWPGVFNVLLLLGAAYVAWLGVRMWREPAALTELQQGSSQPVARRFGGALLTCLLNPKAYVFMIAVFPQFLRPAQGSLFAQAVILGAIIAFTQAAVYGAVAVSASGMRDWLRRSTANQIRVTRAVGSLLLLTAAWTVWHSWTTA
jgi:threonine/homoserine/homoserine lactone efflux protein